MPLTAEDVAQQGLAYRFGWGADGLEALTPDCDVIVIVDVLRFATAVSVAVAGDSMVFRYRWRDDVNRSAQLDATSVAAQLIDATFVAVSPCSLDKAQAGWGDAGFVERQVDNELGAVGGKHVLADQHR